MNPDTPEPSQTPDSIASAAHFPTVVFHPEDSALNLTEPVRELLPDHFPDEITAPVTAASFDPAPAPTPIDVPTISSEPIVEELPVVTAAPAITSQPTSTTPQNTPNPLTHRPTSPSLGAVASHHVTVPAPVSELPEITAHATPDKNKKFVIGGIATAGVLGLILVAVALVFYISNQNKKIKLNDKERVSDISAITAKLEENKLETGYYPSKLKESDLVGLDPQALIDPKKSSIVSKPPAIDLASAVAVIQPNSAENYQYVPYECDATGCQGFILRTYIEKPTADLPNPFTKKSIN